MKTQIIMIIPPYLDIDEINSKEPESWMTSVTVPLGVISIAAYVGKHSSVDFELLDLNVSIAKKNDLFMRLSWDDFLYQEIKLFFEGKSPDIVGVSAIFNSQIGYLDKISEYAKKLVEKTIVITGGGGVGTSMSLEVFEQAPNVDAIAVGEAERPVLNLVNAVNRLDYLKVGKGWKTKQRILDGEIFEHDFIEDLDEIPFFRYDLLDAGFGIQRNVDGASHIDKNEYNAKARYHSGYETNTVTASIMSSRGCPFFCNFCASHATHGRKMRYHSLNRVVQDCIRLREEFGVNTILFEDDLVFANKKKFSEIVCRLADEGFEMDFSSGISVAHLNDTAIEAIEYAKVSQVKLAVESGSERILRDIIKKPYKKLSSVSDVVKKLRNKNIFIRGFWLIGLPGETLEDIFSSLDFYRKTGFNWVALMLASPIAGSELYEDCKKNNLLLNDQIDKYHFGRSNIKLDHSTPAQIEKLRYILNLDLNFVNNYDLKHNNPEKALVGLEDVVSRVDGHAFAYYYLGEAYRLMNDVARAENYYIDFINIIERNESWKKYAKLFNLPVSKDELDNNVLKQKGYICYAKDFSIDQWMKVCNKV